MTASAVAVMVGILTTERFHSGGTMKKSSFAPVIMCLVLGMSALYGVAFVVKGKEINHGKGKFFSGKDSQPV